MVTIGDTLIYRLSSDDVMRIAALRAHMVGQPMPLIVTGTFRRQAGAPESVNGQVMLDGFGALWVVARDEGTEAGEYRPAEAWVAAARRARARRTGALDGRNEASLELPAAVARQVADNVLRGHWR